MQVIANLYSAHMDPKEWDEPHSFKPNRFLNDQGQVIGKERVISFSLGMLCYVQLTHVFVTIMSAVLNIHLADDHWIQASLPVRYTRLGIRSANMLVPSAFLTSATGTSDLQNKMLRSGSVASPDPSFQASF